jgi:hypothetical protein
MSSRSIAAWISWRNPGLLILSVSAMMGLGLAGSSCSLLRAVFRGAAPEPRPFNHEAHTVRGISCIDCHEGAEKEVKAGMPSKAFCMNCHEDIDKEKDKPLEKKVAWFLADNGEPQWAETGHQKEDIKFSHASHAGKTACTACHAGMDKNTGLLPHGPQRMTECVSCHQQRAAAKLDCVSCHSSIDRTHPPENHRQLWTKLHGSCARSGGEISTANNCSLCHQQNSCTTCHQTVPPEDHTNFWRLRAHGVASSLDRSRCSTCHTTDACNRCHQISSPVSHSAGWNFPRDNHCTSCHLPLQASGSCAVCHRDTHGHLTAPPKPAWHNPAMNCVACHGATLRHPNNGDNCNACHH